MLDDLNTPRFIARIHELYNAAREGDNEKKLQFNEACRMIGLFNLSKQDWDNLKKRQINISESFIKEKIKDRIDAKNKGDYKLADKIRDELLSKGIVIEDQKDKTIWKYK